MLRIKTLAETIKALISAKQSNRFSGHYRVMSSDGNRTILIMNVRPKYSCCTNGVSTAETELNVARH
jgi:hypothetical protein